MEDNYHGEDLLISSPVFKDGEYIPAKYTCEGDNINPPLRIQMIPHGVQTLAVIVEDPDAPKGVFDHWLVWNIERMEQIGENTTPGISGRNGTGKTGYYGPCPPSGSHRYFFHVYALDNLLDLEPGASKEQLETAMGGHIMGRGSLMGYYRKTAPAAGGNP